jgi:nitrogen-specific signal transduction histidine kinase
MLHEVPPKTSDPNAVIAELEKLLRDIVGDRISFRTDLDPQLGRVTADRNSLGWALLNLAVNALKAMLARSVVITTTNTDLDPGAASDMNLSPGPYVRIELGVTGSGVDAQPAIWNLVQEANGAVSVNAAGAAGVMVTILLPRMPVSTRGCQ